MHFGIAGMSTTLRLTLGPQTFSRLLLQAFGQSLR